MDKQINYLYKTRCMECRDYNNFSTAVSNSIFLGMMNKFLKEQQLLICQNCNKTTLQKLVSWGR